MTPEGKVKQWIDRTMLGWFPSLFKYRPPGGFYGRSGMPDSLYFIPANEDICICVAIEAKVPGNRATDLQMSTLKKLKACGVLVAVVTGKDIDRMGMIHGEIVRRISMANSRI